MAPPADNWQKLSLSDALPRLNRNDLELKALRIDGEMWPLVTESGQDLCLAYIKAPLPPAPQYRSSPSQALCYTCMKGTHMQSMQEGRSQPHDSVIPPCTQSLDLHA